MKICVIGNGIIGHLSSQYLSNKGHNIDCISPDIDLASELSQKNNYAKINTKKKELLSVKFKREDLIHYKKMSDNYFRKKLNNFFALELACEMGLAKFWGANLAFVDSFSLSHAPLTCIQTTSITSLSSSVGFHLDVSIKKITKVLKIFKRILIA